MPPERRRTLVDAGVDLVMQQRFQDLLASVDTRSITERAGVTTGSFFHHFSNRAQFAEMVAERFRELWDASVDRLVADIEALAASDDVGEVRSVAQADWDHLEAADAEATLLHLLWVARRQPLAGDGEDSAGEALRRAYGSLLDKAVPAYRRALGALGREPMPPFDLTDLAVTLTALADGIQMRQAVQPEAVRSTLLADLAAGIVIALTRPVGERAERIDLAALEAGLRVPALTDGLRLTGDRETWRHIADAAAPLFDRRPVTDVKVAEIAAAAGVSASTVHHHFASVAEVAACGLARFIPELEAIATRPITATEGPVLRMEQVLTRVVEIGKRHRGALEGLMTEVVATAGPDDESVDRRRPIRHIVPLSPLLAPLVREVRARGELRRRIDSLALSRTIVQLVAMRVLSAPDDPVERIIDDSLGLVLEGAMTRGGGR